MANSDKNILIIPGTNQSGFPNIKFVGSSSAPISLNVLDDNTVAFSGSQGQVFSINNNLTGGTIFSVNDVSGIPSIEVNANGKIVLGRFGGNVGIGTNSPSQKLHVSGSTNIDQNLIVAGSTTIAAVSGTTAQFTILTGSTVTGSTGLFTTITGSIVTGSTFLGTTARFTTVTGSTVTGSTGLFTQISASALIVTGAYFTDQNAYIKYSNFIDSLLIFPGLNGIYVTGSVTASVTVTAQTGSFSLTTGSTAQFTVVTGSTVTGSTFLGTTARFTTVTGSTVTGSTGLFTTITGSIVTGSTARFTEITASVISASLYYGPIVASTLTLTGTVALSSSQAIIQSDQAMSFRTRENATGSYIERLSISTNDIINVYSSLNGTSITASVLTANVITSSVVLTGATAQFTTVTGSIITGSTALFTAITGTTVVATTYQAGVGSVSAVSYGFGASGIDTGLYRTAANQLGIATNGVEAVRFVNQSSGAQIQMSSLGGVAGAPTLTWNGNTNTGIFRQAADTIGFSTNGIERLRITTTGLFLTASLSGSVVTGSSIYGQIAELSNQAVSNYTLQTSDSGKYLTMNTSSANTVTVPTGLPLGYTISICQLGTGQTTISASVGVTINNRQSQTKTAGQYAVVSLVGTSLNTYVLSGDTGA